MRHKLDLADIFFGRKPLASRAKGSGLETWVSSVSRERGAGDKTFQPPVSGKLSRFSNLEPSGARIRRRDDEAVLDSFQTEDGATAHRQERSERNAAGS